MVGIDTALYVIGLLVVVQCARYAIRLTKEIITILVKINFNLAQLQHKIGMQTSTICGYIGAAEQNISKAITDKDNDE